MQLARFAIDESLRRESIAHSRDHYCTARAADLANALTSSTCRRPLLAWLSSKWQRDTRFSMVFETAENKRNGRVSLLRHRHACHLSNAEDRGQPCLDPGMRRQRRGCRYVPNDVMIGFMYFTLSQNPPIVHPEDIPS